ncbi:MAG TPA: hypothetical protein PK108_15665, partial [Pyrinomonadaceae bacterium]|nr:hypothetical protein [Pyrinomonadaceae bacterium]
PELSGAEVDAQCVDALGAPRGARVRVDVGTISAASRYPLNVRLATASDGTSVVVWQENPRDSAIPPSVFYRRLAADCTPLGNVGSLGAVGVVGRRETHVALRPGTMDRLTGVVREPAVRAAPAPEPSRSFAAAPAPAARILSETPPPETRKTELLEVAGETIEEKLAAKNIAVKANQLVLF